MIPLLLAMRSASATEACDLPQILDTLPSDGDVDVPPDAVVTAILDAVGSCLTIAAEASDAAGDLPTTVSAPDDWFARVVPDDPLTVGSTTTFRLDDHDGDGVDIAFTVGAAGVGTVTPDRPSQLSLEAGECGAVGATEVTIDARWNDPADDARGVLRPSVWVDGRRQSIGPGAVYRGEASATLAFDVFGPGEVCALVALDDVTGVERWRSREVCAAERLHRCGDGPIGAIRCATGPVGGAAWTALALATIGALSRRRGRSPIRDLTGRTGDAR